MPVVLELRKKFLEPKLNHFIWKWRNLLYLHEELDQIHFFLAIHAAEPCFKCPTIYGNDLLVPLVEEVPLFPSVLNEGHHFWWSVDFATSLSLLYSHPTFLSLLLTPIGRSKGLVFTVDWVGCEMKANSLLCLLEFETLIILCWHFQEGDLKMAI